MTDTDTQHRPGSFLAPGSPERIGGSPGFTWDRRATGTLRLPSVGIPDEIDAAYRKYRAYVDERSALRQEADNPAIARRVAAFGLLVDDARRDLHAALTAHSASWGERIDEMTAAATSAYSAATDLLDTARRDAHEARTVLGWLDRGRTSFAPTPPRRLDLEATWHDVIAALRADVGEQASEEERRPSRPHAFAAQSVRNTVATLATLDMPDALEQPYTDHRKLAEQHTALSTERRTIEQGRKAAEAADRRALADSIRDGKPDPGDKHAAKLDAQLSDLDRRRADVSVQLRQSYSDLWDLVDQRRAAWRDTVAARHAQAAGVYRDVVEQIDRCRGELDQLRQAGEWLAQVDADEVRSFRARHQQPAAGQPWARVTEALRDDVAQLGGDAA